MASTSVLRKIIAPAFLLSALVCLPLSSAHAATPVEKEHEPVSDSYSEAWLPVERSTKQAETTETETQSTVLVDDADPALCNFMRDGYVRDVCSRFRLTRIDDPEFSAYQFEFWFENVRVTYGVLSDATETIDSENKTFDVYPVIGRILESRDQEPQFSDQDEGECISTADFTELACGLPDFIYQYTQ
ncbi:hypothetical protein PN498_27620 [Oscillatoria sp. CS-180]|uniref:hypothetical protein n=1 Tax=Oscillatoria sp. CS-180 TaxID=3021720 RepID=UPI00232E9ACE|nr:hypothetical protein [Oscillatoria sp. CS-180]MDB9529787.1 hypothetical protein [Oscillatoria sp. CS-180]